MNNGLTIEQFGVKIIRLKQLLEEIKRDLKPEITVILEKLKIKE